MIGAMPAVAVRHERRRAEKRGGGRRPSQLPLQLGRAPEDATPSPDHHRLRNELYVCGKVAALHAIVGSLLLGIVVLVVGLVQLSPGAEAAQHRYYLMGAGAALVGIGVIAAILRCICLHWFNRKFREEEEDEALEQAHKNGVSVVESGHKHDHKTEHKGDHKTDHKGDHKGDHKTDHKGDHKGDHKTDHKGDHKTDHKGDHKTDHKGDHKTDHKGDHKSDHKADHKGDKDHKTDHKHISEKADKPRLKSQASVGRDMDLVKQPSAASDT